MSKERPILFSPEMVKATLALTKTNTRRTTGLDQINEDPTDWQCEWFDYQVGWCFTQKSTVNEKTLKDGSFNQVIIKCPYGLVGDLLFVRENWRPYLRGDGPDGFKRLVQLTADGFEVEVPDTHIEWFNRVEGMGYKQRPSIHLPKFGSRIWLELTCVTVQRLQNIREHEALSEGVIEYEDGTYHNYFTQKGLRAQDGVDIILAKGSFQSLWCSIHGIDSWQHNPWVWAITFKVLSTTGKPKPETQYEHARP